MNRTDTYKIIGWLKAQVEKLEGLSIYPSIKDKVERLRGSIRELEEEVEERWPPRTLKQSAG